jgi:hypothetical protein
MKIRPYLIVFLIIITAIVVSLILFPTLSNLDGPPAVTITDTPTIEPSVPEPYQGTKVEPTTVIHVGESGGGLPIQVWNDTPTNRTVSVELIHNDSDSSLVTPTEILPPNVTLRLEIRSPAGYLLRVTDESTQTTGTYPVTNEHFDCNSRFAEVRIDANGIIDSRTISTDMGCGL